MRQAQQNSADGEDMADGFKNKPKTLKGAFVEYGISIPPLFVVFQFNPEELSRNRSLTFRTRSTDSESAIGSLREDHQREYPDQDDLIAIRDDQQVTIQEEAISFDIRLDATEKMSEGDVITAGFGLGPILSTLELMVLPKSDSMLGALVDAIFPGGDEGFSFTRSQRPPMILFIWGHKRVLPVNIESLNITETEFNTNLDPIRATANVSLRVIEGKNIPYGYTKLAKEVMSVLNLANIADVADVVIPG